MVDESKSDTIITFPFLVLKWKWEKFKEKIKPKKPNEFFNEIVNKIIEKGE